MSVDTLKEKTAKGLFWGGLSNGIQQLLSLVFGIFLARMLTQADYGMVGVLTIFSNMAAALQEGGFISALNKKAHVTHADYNAVFWFSVLCSLAIYSLLFFAAPLIARFYGEPTLVPLSRYLFLGFVISSLSIAPRAYLFRNLMVKESTVIGICALTVSGVAGVALAFFGYAFWGIATQSLVFVAVTTWLNFHFSRWRPSLRFHFSPIRDFIGFSSKLVVTNLFTIVNHNLFSNLLGKFYSVTEVGNFTQANKWNYMGHTLITNMLNGVAQPVFTKVENDRGKQLAVFRKLLRFTAFVSFPAMFGLSLISHELIVLAITERWLDSAGILSTLCVWGAFVPICSLFSNLLISRGHSSIYMWNTIALCLVQLVAAIAIHPWGLAVMLRLFVAIHVLWLFVWLFFVHREIGLTVGHVLQDAAPYLLLSVALAGSAHYLVEPVAGMGLRLACKVAFVAVLYVAVLRVAGSVVLRESWQFIRQRVCGKEGG